MEQIGKVLGVSRTSIYRALSPATAPAPSAASSPAAPAPAPAPAAPAPAAAAESVAGQKPAAVPAEPPSTEALASGAQPVVRSRGRSRWFVVQADPDDPEHGPVAVLSGHTTEKAATTALGKAGSRASARSAPAARERVLLQVRAAEQITSRLIWDAPAGRGLVQPGPPP